MTLAETQARLHAAITGGGPHACEGLDGWLVGTPELPAAERVGIYAGMYRARLADALRQTFPALAGYLGEERFEGLAADYVDRHPSEHHDVAQLGRRLAGFLREHPAPERPDLGDLAALEWARQEAFFAPEPAAAPADASLLAALPPEAIAAEGLALTPSLELLRLDHDPTPLWRALDGGAEAAPPQSGPAAVAVWRVGHEVAHAALEADEADALAVALAGGSIAEACEVFAGAPEPAQAALRALAGWFAEGWVVGRRPGVGSRAGQAAEG
ncbi:MAG: putative DNA-binding domain-containing protein [Anaeromyxobacteraceae bacterium]|nr:putative DNA-binding domain-containing protein [Anaeromyxobacteraceae bacterium]